MILFVLFLGIGVIFYAMSIPRPAYPSGTRCLALSCIDLRYVTTVNRFMERTFGFNSFDYTANPGSALSIGLGSGSLLAPGPAVDSILRDAFNRTAAISFGVNGPEILCIFEHEGCGYYKFQDGSSSDQVLMDNQKTNLVTIADQIRANSDLKQSGTSFFREIRGYYVYLSGHVELVHKLV
jgi:hypothetical protein